MDLPKLHDEIEEKEKFEVDTFEKADWAIAKMAEAQSQIDKAERIYKQYIERLNSWKTSMTEHANKTIAFFADKLRPYCETQIDDKKRSVEFPQGTAKFRKSESVNVADDNIVIDWLEENAPDKVVVKKSFMKSDLKKIVTGGQIIPGVDIVKKENYTVELHPIDKLLQ